MSRRSVLIVDDSPANLKVARVALEAEDYEIRTATGGEEAWSMLSSFAPSLILMDLQMPGLDGFQLTRRIKADRDKRHIRIVAVTAYAMKGDRERALAAGCDGYLAKPIDPILLPGFVASHLSAMSSKPPAPLPTETPEILVVEDNSTTRKLIQVTLASEGLNVWDVPDGRSALEWVEHHRPSLVLQDLVLPDIDGLELVRGLRKRLGPDIPILCLSGFLARMDEAKAVDDGFNAVLVKPIDPIQLLAVVRQYLAPNRSTKTFDAENAPHVLVIDDDPFQLRLAEYHLSSAGLRVTVMQDARRALELAEHSVPDVIVSDVVMPEMNGFELCLKVRSHPLLANVPVILVSSHFSEPADGRLAMEVGATAFVPRTGYWTGALDRVREALGQPKAPQPNIDADAAREAILRRTLVQLEQQQRVNAQLAQQCLLQGTQLSVLAGIADALAHNTQLDGVLADVLAVCLDLAGISKGALYLRREGVLAPTRWIGFSTDESLHLRDFFGHWPCLEESMQTGRVIVIPSSAFGGEVADDFLLRAGVSGAMLVPVAWGEHCYGALLLGAQSVAVTGSESLAFARVLGTQMGQAIGLADAFERLYVGEQKFRALVDSMDHVTVVDRERRVTGMYGRGLEREGVDPHSVIGLRIEDVIGRVDQAAHEIAHRRALTGESVVYDYSFVWGPSLRHFQAAVSPVRDAHGHVCAVVRVGRDVTEQKRLQAQVMVSDRMASVGMLAAGVAHEINNPLMAVLGNLDLVLAWLKPDSTLSSAEVADLHTSLQDAFEASQRVESIVRDLRLFSRAEEERTWAIDVQSVLESTLRMARNQIRHRANLVTNFQRVPTVRANQSRLGQVFLNLLMNAVQAIPEGHADTNEIRVSTDLDADGRVIIDIADTGCGVSEALRSRLFTPFVTTKPANTGTGLGLAICQRIVTGLGGEISFESRSGGGTIFRVVLLPDPSEAVEVQPPVASYACARRGRILIIDDEVMLGELVKRALGRDHEVVFFSNATQALERLGSGANFDVILCDLMMPVMTGAEFHERLVQLRPDHADRVVFFTGAAFSQGARDFLQRVPNLCLEKPVNIRALRSLISERVA